MLFLLISVLSFFLLFANSLPLKPLPSWVSGVRLLSIWFWQEFLHIVVCSIRSFRVKDLRAAFPLEMASKRKCAPKEEKADGLEEMSIMDLPDLALECILGKLPPAGLCNMACVCKSLRERCRSDFLWERHMREKWGKVIGQSARREWEWYLNSTRDPASGVASAEKTLKSKRWIVASLSCVWLISWIKSRLDCCGGKPRSTLPDDTIMSWYLSLESGKFWFPAQVYNREHGHVGFMLSCYDAELSYDCCSDTFQARYPPHGRRTIVVEDGVEWERIRAPPMETPAHDLHVSDCLHDLRPGDHIEIQWRRNKEFPYGWWYGIVGHLESCGGSEYFCRCHQCDTALLEFNQYTPGSRWRRTTINRKNHREEGNETDGFYGGIRKLYTKDEISTWKQLWPVEVLE